MPKILVVDDEPDNRALMTMILEHLGHEVFAAPDGSEGLRVAREQSPALVILDMFMPGMSGAQFVKHLRTLPEASAVRIALYTATEEDGAMRQFMELSGIDYIIPKPSQPEDVMRIVREALRSTES